MFIQCGSCKKNFCGYCHQGTESAMGAHDHVRSCGQIKMAQRKHRTRELKKFLQPLKKDVQNAKVLELEIDLKFHSIAKAALFEIGNLQREIEFL